MTEPTIRIYRQSPLDRIPTYIGRCCREWPMPVGLKPGRCGLCGERPEFVRVDNDPIDRCDGCNMNRVFCEATRDMERRPCCDACSH
jgi:hypothetical protein